MWLAAIVIAVLATQICWECGRIRRELADMGFRLERIRWLPFKPLFDGRWSRRRMYYRIEYTGKDGAAFIGVAVWTLFQGLSIQEQRPNIADGQGASSSPSLRVPWLATTCSVLTCLAIGAEYWARAYDQTSLPGGLLTFGLLALAVAAAVLQVMQPERWLSTLPILAFAPAATVIVRVAMDVSRDPTTHGLLPFEIMIGCLVGAGATFAGTAIGWLARHLIEPPTPGSSVPVRTLHRRSSSRSFR